MFIDTGNTRVWYTRNGQQASGHFLVLMQPNDEPVRRGVNNLRALVRTVKLSQLGQFMMGDLRVGPFVITVSGTYGSDGLPVDVPRKVWEHGVPLPDYLFEAWNKGGGWNGAGSEAGEMRKWARENIKALTKPYRR